MSATVLQIPTQLNRDALLTELRRVCRLRLRDLRQMRPYCMDDEMRYALDNMTNSQVRINDSLESWVSNHG